MIVTETLATNAVFILHCLQCEQYSLMYNIFGINNPSYVRSVGRTFEVVRLK